MLWSVLTCLWSCCCHLGFIVYYLYCIGQYSHVFEWRNWSIAPKELYLSFLLQFNAITQLVLINFIVGSVCSGTNCFYPFFIWFPLSLFFYLAGEVGWRDHTPGKGCKLERARWSKEQSPLFWWFGIAGKVWVRAVSWISSYNSHFFITIDFNIEM